MIRTYYDEAPYGISAFGSAGQENLRNRVATVTIEALYTGPSDTDYDYATHYSYDISGNVKTLVQDIKELADIDQRFKRIDYTYDYISGNVHEVVYQSGADDQFAYHYEYDANNRLTKALTSTAATEYNMESVWCKEAEYEYYDHGPLARTTIGEFNVQGMDYAYTLQGWIKGLNSSQLDPMEDMGKDGAGIKYHPGVARDAYSYTLGYYNGDYINLNTLDGFEISYAGTPLVTSPSNGARELFNGNIRLIWESNRQLNKSWGHSYRYDQLNRLNDMINWNTPTSASTEYRIQSLRYDANGNILGLRRRAQSGVMMDNLTYHYLPGTNQLNYVADPVSAGLSTADIDNQSSGNYLYDGAGNLTDGAQSGTHIDWTVYGKVAQVTHNSGDVVKYGYGPDQNRIEKNTVAGGTGAGISTYYIRDAQGNVLAVYEKNGADFYWKEQHLYGSNRLGIFKPELDLLSMEIPATQKQLIGKRAFEITNHLGNVMAVINDRKTVAAFVGDSATLYDATFLSAGLPTHPLRGFFTQMPTGHLPCGCGSVVRLVWRCRD